MKILYVTSHKRSDPSGGAIVAWELAEEMATREDVVLLAPGNKNGFQKEKSGLGVFYVESIGNFHLNFNYLTLRTIRKILAFLDDFHPDIVHVHAPYDLGLLAQVWAIRNNVPYFFTLHMLLSTASSWGETESAGILTGMLSNFALDQYIIPYLENCTAVIALNEAVKTDLKEFGFLGNIEKIPNGRHLKKFMRLRITGIKEKRKKLLYVGSVMPWKNQLFLVEVMRYLPDSYELDLAGSYQDSMYKRKITKYIQQQGIRNVRLLGRVEQENIPSLLERSHLFVSASKAEAQALVIIEALASGTPVIGLANVTVEEFVDDAVGKCLPLGTSPLSFAREVQILAEQQEQKYFRMCERSRGRVVDLDWKRVVSQTRDVYRKYRGSPGFNARPGVSIKEVVNLIPNKQIRDYLLQEIPVPMRVQRSSSKSRVPMRMMLFLGGAAVASVSVFLGWKYWKRLKDKSKALRKRIDY